jgi:hypothetical protein
MKDKPPSTAAVTRQSFLGLRTMSFILHSKNDLGSGIAASAPMNAD